MAWTARWSPLAVELEGAMLATLTLHLSQGRDEHAAGAAGGIVDALSRLGRQHLHHEMYHSAIGIEFLGGVAAVIGELFDQEFVAIAKLILRYSFKRQGVRGEVLDQVLEGGIRQALFIAHARGFKPPPLGGAFRLPSTISENYGTPQG